MLAQRHSNYKKYNTVKFLIGITPTGSISFLSQCWVGRGSDKNLTQESNFFNLVENGDTVLADRGFTIADDLAIHGVKLEIDRCRFLACERTQPPDFGIGGDYL